jgi:hypothetical protein
MKINKNEKLIKRNAKIGQYTNIAGLLLVVGTIFLLIQLVNNPESATQNNTFLIWGILFLGIALSQISMYFGSRFGRRPDEALDKTLKGLPGDHTIYHYTSPVPHLLVGASGIWLLLPYSLRGRVIYKKNRWRVAGGGFAQSYLRLFGQETIGRPDLEAEGQTATLEKFLKKKLEEGDEIPPISAILVFLDENIEIDAADASLPAVQAKKLKEFLRKIGKEQQLPPEDVERVKTALSEDKK